MSEYTVIPQTVNVDNVTLQNVAGVVSVKNGGIDTSQLAFTVGTKKLGQYALGADSATWTVSNALNLSITKTYLLVYRGFTSGSDGDMALFLNNDLTGTNYNSQYTRNGAGGTANDNRALGASGGGSNKPTTSVVYLTFQGGIPHMKVLCNWVTSAGAQQNHIGTCEKTATVASVTQLDVKCTSGNIVSGATMDIYEMG